MNEVIRRRRPLAMFLIKILIVLLFPLDGILRSSNFGWMSILLFVNSDPVSIYISLSSLLPALVIMLPCLIFEQQLNSNPISKSIRGRAVGAAILCWTMGMYFPSPLILPYESYYPFVMQYAPVLAISFFIILPLISREATIRRISTEHQILSYRHISSTLRKEIRREKILAGVLWACLVFCPFIFYWNYMGWSIGYQFMSFFYTLFVTPWSVIAGYLAVFPYVSIQFMATFAGLLPFIALLSALRFVFVRDVFRFQKGLVKKPRLASIAVLAEILPSAILIFMSQFLYPPDSVISVLFFPFPILPIIGFIFIRFSRITPVREELWPDYEHRMWFEKERKPHTPETMEESIKVPITYLLVSQIRRRRKE